LILIAPFVCATMIAGCASSRPSSAIPPRLTLPPAATTPCRLESLPADPTLADLDRVYLARGAALLACDGARQLAVDTLLAERGLQDAWRTGVAAPR
jgi:hypothetical protein